MLACEHVDNGEAYTHFVKLHLFEQSPCLDEQTFDHPSDGVEVANDRHFVLHCSG